MNTEAAKAAQVVAIADHFGEGTSPVSVSAATSNPPGGAPSQGTAGQASSSGCSGCLVPALVIVAILFILGQCTGLGDGPTGKYTDEECVALQLSAISGDDDSLTEYSVHCDD